MQIGQLLDNSEAKNEVLIPDPLAGDKEYARYHHLDIQGLTDVEVMDEYYALRPCLWGLPSDHWLRQRVKALGIEKAKRRRGHL